MSERFDPRYITEVCNRCDGDGEYEIPQAGGSPIIVDCGSCGGLGVERTQRRDVLEGNIVYAYEILDATDTTEYNALSVANKVAYNMVLSCGIVDLSEGTQSHTKLWNIFDSESTTRANLIALLA